MDTAPLDITKANEPISQPENVPSQNIQENDPPLVPVNSPGSPLPESDKKVLGKKVKKSGDTKFNRELCSICRDGGNLLLCDYCPRSFHIECLKIKEENIPEGKWYCPMCAPKIQKKLEKNNSQANEPEDKEKERKRLIKNEKRRLWRLKKKEQLEALKKSQKDTVLVNKDGNTLIDSFLKDNNNKSSSNGNYLDYINKMDKLPLNNSKICVNITYSALTEQDHQNKTLSLPLLFPIPNNILIIINSIK